MTDNIGNPEGTFAWLVPESDHAIRALDRTRPEKGVHAYFAQRLWPVSWQRLASRWAYTLSTDDFINQLGEWRMGSGLTTRGKKAGLRGVQFLLCTVRDKKTRHQISGLQGRFFLNMESGAWMFKNMSQEHRVAYLGGLAGGGDLVLSYNQSTVLWQLQNRLSVGPYVYQFRFPEPWDESWHIAGAVSSAQEAKYLAARGAILSHLSLANISPYLSPLPRSTHERIKDYVLHDNTIAASLRQSSRVQAGVDANTGEPVAAKHLFYNNNMPGQHLGQYWPHVTSMRAFADCPTGILPLYYRRIECHNIPGGTSDSQYTIIIMPLAMSDFGRFDFDTTSHNIRMELYRQTLQGLATIHERGYIHCGIKPSHLLVRSAHPSSPSAAICDFGNSTEGPSRDGRDTTAVAHTMAPELWIPNSNKTYAADVWSLAYSWLWTLGPLGGSDVPGFRDNPPKPDSMYGVVKANLEGLVTPKRHASIMAHIDQAVNHVFPPVPTTRNDPNDVGVQFKKLLREMLAWDPDERISAAKALESPVWDSPGERPSAPESAGPSASARAPPSRPNKKARPAKKGRHRKAATSEQ